MRSLLAILLTVAATSLLLAGCGDDGTDVASARACLEEAGFEVEGLQDEDRRRMEAAAIGTWESKDGTDQVTAMAGRAKSAEAVEEFERKTEDGEDAMKTVLGDDGRFESGSDGRYVWAYGGSSKVDRLEDGKRCVQP